MKQFFDEKLYLQNNFWLLFHMTKAECLKKRTFTVGKKDIYKRSLERKTSQKELVFFIIFASDGKFDNSMGVRKRTD